MPPSHGGAPVLGGRPPIPFQTVSPGRTLTLEITPSWLMVMTASGPRVPYFWGPRYIAGRLKWRLAV